MKYCTKCGKPNKDDSKFCEYCGQSFNDNPNPDMNTGFNQNQNNGFNQGYVNPEIKKPVSSLGLVSMILGIISLASLVICCCIPVIALITGPVAIILGIIFLVRYKNENKNQATIGIVLGAIGFVIGLILLITILTTDVDALKQMALDECNTDPTGATCQMYRELFPQWFS